MGETRRAWAGSTLRYGGAGESVDWRIAIEHYHWDRLDQAYDMAVQLGVGGTGAYGRFFRQIEAEHLTRQRSEQERLEEWLRLEGVAEELEGSRQLREGVVEACDVVAQRLGWKHGAPTMVSVLARDANAPWAVGRFGYCVDKYPYDKVCIPNRDAFHPQRLRETVAHEYAHVITLNLSEGKVPRYLDEAVAMSAGGQIDEGVMRAFSSGRIEWLQPEDLNAAYMAESNDALGGRQLWFAYQQSAAIGQFLISIKGERGLADLMRAFSDNSAWTELKMRVINQPPADEALRQVYGFGESDLFARTLEWLS